VRFVNGTWSSYRTLAMFKQRHRRTPYDAMIVYNLKQPQVACASHAFRSGIPVVLEYEDDAFVDLQGRSERGLRSRWRADAARQVMAQASACIGVSPHLLSQVRPGVPKVLLRGVVDDDILAASRNALEARKNWVVYSGTHFRGKGLEELVEAWGRVDLPGWELHIAGRGELTARLEERASRLRSVMFHGLLNRCENATLLSQAKIGINPHDLSGTPGNVFAFKIIEYLAAGAHCITTPMGALESDIESGITYMSDNSPATIAATLERVVHTRDYERLAAQAAQDTYGPDAVARSLDGLLTNVALRKSA
jgi:glycosyltransferase involved in cell wall biosynthesis